MIRITLKGPKGLGSLTNLPEEIKNNLFRGMQDGALLIERTSKEKYLTGPYPQRLSVDTGRLRSGVYAYAGLSGMSGEFGRIVVKSTTWYGKVHEQMGYSESESSSAMMGSIGSPFTGFTILAKTKKGMHFFWKRRNIMVHGARMVVIPARPFLRPAVMENLEKIRILLNRMISQAYKAAKARP